MSNVIYGRHFHEEFILFLNPGGQCCVCVENSILIGSFRESVAPMICSLSLFEPKDTLLRLFFFLYQLETLLDWLKEMLIVINLC